MKIEIEEKNSEAIAQTLYTPFSTFLPPPLQVCAQAPEYADDNRG